jgi:hypothetical protein
MDMVLAMKSLWSENFWSTMPPIVLLIKSILYAFLNTGLDTGTGTP